MAIDPEKLVLTARDMLTELPESVMLSRDTLMGLVRPAISVWQDLTNNDPLKRQNFVITSDAITVTDGIADLADVLDDPGYRLEYIASGDITVSTIGVDGYRAAKVLNSRDRLYRNGRQDKFRDLVYIQGTKMLVKGKGNTIPENTNGTVVIASPVIPSDLEEINEPVMYEIATVIADLARKQVGNSKK